MSTAPEIVAHAKIDYSDFYKFLVSLGVLLLFGNIVLRDIVPSKGFGIYLDVIFSAFGICLIIAGSLKWLENQKILDSSLKEHLREKTLANDDAYEFSIRRRELLRIPIQAGVKSSTISEQERKQAKK